MKEEYQTYAVRRAYAWMIAFVLSLALTVLFVEGVTLQIKAILLSIFVSLAITWLAWDWLDRQVWKLNRRLIFGRPRIGILSERGMNPVNSDYPPGDWIKEIGQHLEAEEVDLGHFDAPFGRQYAVIVNPYGEGYPEESTLSQRTFERIEEFVYNGGIFASIGGYPFFYAIDIGSKQLTPIAEISKGYAGHMDNRGSIVLQEAIIRNSLSLYEGTIATSRFNYRATTGTSELVELHQEEGDKEFCGDLLGKEKVQVYQFRSLVAPLAGARPMARAESKDFGTIYPLVTFPYGRGYFVLGGVRLHSTDLDRKTLNSANCDAGFRIGCEAIVNLALQIQKGKIKPHEERAD